MSFSTHLSRCRPGELYQIKSIASRPAASRHPPPQTSSVLLTRNGLASVAQPAFYSRMRSSRRLRRNLGFGSAVALILSAQHGAAFSGRYARAPSQSRLLSHRAAASGQLPGSVPARDGVRCSRLVLLSRDPSSTGGAEDPDEAPLARQVRASKR